MGGFFDGADIVFATPASSVAALGVPAEATTLPTKSIPIDKGTHNRKVSEAILVPVETLTPQEVATLTIIQTEATSLVTPLVISTIDPFAVLSQVVKDGSSLVIAPSSIPISIARGHLMWTYRLRGLRMSLRT